MLLKPCSGPSTKYMTVPKSTETIKTKNTKMKIFALLALSALSRLFDSPTKRTSFRILKTRNNRKARKAVIYCEPTTKNDRYLGMVERKSTTPKKLKMYLLGFLMQMILKIYSIVKSTVTIHSEISRNLWYLMSKRGTLSSITTMIL